MQTLEQAREYLAFNEWANGLVLVALKNSDRPNELAVRAFAHLLLAEKIWLRRVLESLDTTGYDFWEGNDVAFCETAFTENKKAFGEFFAALTEEKLDRVITYKNSSGVQFSNTIREVLSHIFFHSVHHRGQVLTHIRAAGEKPPYIDFVGFLRRK